MLDLRRDLYSHLVISAQKNRELNKPFLPRSNLVVVDNPKHFPAEISAPKISKQAIPKRIETSKVAEISRSIDGKISKVSSVPLSYPIKTLPKNISHTEKIDEKVAKIIENPLLFQIRNELENSEIQLKRIKLLDWKNPKIPSIEQTISRLKNLLEQKSYV